MLQCSRIWKNVDVLHLQQNMRVHDNDDSLAFAHWLLDIGHSRSSSQDTTSTISILQHMCCTSENDLIESVYNTLNNHGFVPPPHFFRDRAILAPRNDEIRSLNTTILSRLPGVECTYSSADSYSIESPGQEQNDNIPVEFLHTLNASGLPVADLRLKIGCPILLLRNIDKKRGLCNGTRATITDMSNRVLQICVMSSDHIGEMALIPRITLSPSPTDLDFAIKLNRRQFPIQLAFAMTINKAQGQTVKRVGIDLRNPVFSHSQLYVAFSRATSPEHVKVLLPLDSPASKTTNVVFPEVLLE
jgi:hypothetical protein